MEQTRRNLSTVVVAAAILSWASLASAATITLSDGIDRALHLAPSVDVAAAASDMSVAHVREQRAPLFPTVGAGAEYYQAPGYNEVITNRGLSAGMLTLDYTAWDWGRRQARLRAAEYVSEASRLGVAAARAQIVFDTSIAYFDLLRARGAQRDLQASLDRLRRYVTTIEQLEKSGRAITNDVLKFRTARDSTELALDAARGNLERASAALGILIGEPHQPDLDIASLNGVPPKPSGDLAQSPVMQAAQRAIASASSQIEAAKAERLPTFQVAFTTGFVGIDPPATISHNLGGSYDGVMSVPVFDGGLISSHIDQAKAKEHSATAQARQAEYILKRRVADASLRYDEANRQLDILARAQPTADDNFALTWTRFLGGGTATMLEVLDAYQQAEQLRLQRHDQEFNAREAVAETNLLFGRIQ
ncbi:MAG TPA: TolC family protein [Candidatus Binatus sp.]|uniref:TolC family protein n=1 Tax=Candidatus Binatus sp. TaxID=2811406 RepID=UPI002B48A675|nr:TolC family protein [Candidatus Binatus sp.]HKN13221.1 TolC family protein [Candidatus Binatus sp.]